MGKLLRRIVLLGACAFGANYAYKNVLDDEQRKLVDSVINAGKNMAGEAIKFAQRELSGLAADEQVSNESNSAWVQQQWSNIGF